MIFSLIFTLNERFQSKFPHSWLIWADSDRIHSCIKRWSRIYWSVVKYCRMVFFFHVTVLFTVFLKCLSGRIGGSAPGSRLRTGRVLPLRLLQDQHWSHRHNIHRNQLMPPSSYWWTHYFIFSSCSDLYHDCDFLLSSQQSNKVGNLFYFLLFYLSYSCHNF